MECMVDLFPLCFWPEYVFIKCLVAFKDSVSPYFRRLNNFLYHTTVHLQLQDYSALFGRMAADTKASYAEPPMKRKFSFLLSRVCPI